MDDNFAIGDSLRKVNNVLINERPVYICIYDGEWQLPMYDGYHYAMHAVYDDLDISSAPPFISDYPAPDQAQQRQEPQQEEPSRADEELFSLLLRTSPDVIHLNGRLTTHASSLRWLAIPGPLQQHEDFQNAPKLFFFRFPEERSSQPQYVTYEDAWQELDQAQTHPEVGPMARAVMTIFPKQRIPQGQEKPASNASNAPNISSPPDTSGMTPIQRRRALAHPSQLSPARPPIETRPPKPTQQG